MSQRFLIIANPIAGGGRGTRKATELQQALQSHGLSAELFFTQASGDAGQRASSIGAAEFDGVIPVGGDGTVNEVLDGLPDPSLPMGVLAMGTANVLALELRLPRDPAALAAVVAAGHLQSAAIGRVNGRRFLLFVSMGLDASIVQRVEEVRRGGTLGKMKWAGPILHTIRRWPVDRLGFTTAEGTRADDLSTVLVTRVRTYGGLLHLPDSIDIGDGRLHVLGFRQRSRWRYLCAVLRALLGRLRDDRDVVHAVTSGLRIDAANSDVPWQVDGDLGGVGGPLQIELEPRQARLFVPFG